jgi:peptidoglycan/xylan/chitin deacetylase (PgdA/CDA1 family)
MKFSGSEIFSAGKADKRIQEEMSKKTIRFISCAALFACTMPLFGFVKVEYAEQRAIIIKKYGNAKPHRWGMYIPGVKRRIKTDKKIIALTFDACGGTQGKQYDRELLEYLKANDVHATLFVTTSWIGYNKKAFADLVSDGFFELENHGFSHKPASVTGASAWKIRGTRNVGECFDEVEKSAEEFEKLTGRRPMFYRSGTAFYDDVAVNVIHDTNQIPMNFSTVTADCDKVLTVEKVNEFFWKNLGPGSVIIMHFNHPGGKTLKVIRSAIPKLKEKGYSFVKLGDYASQLE